MASVALSSSASHITFAVWPENVHNNYDMMNMWEVDGHLRPFATGKGTGKLKGEPEDPRWLREDLDRLKPKLIEDCILESLPEEAKVSGLMCAQCSTESHVVDTHKSTMRGGGGLLEAVHLAYNFDKELTISPDDMLLTILSGVSSHVAQAPEKHRHAFVSSEGKVEILVDCDEDPDSWAQAGVFEQMSKKMREHTGELWQSSTLCDFSTSTDIERLLSQLGFMSATKHYFEFKVRGMCGIKSITLTGTVEDWCRLREKIEAFAVLDDLDFWLQELRIVLDQFVCARKGHISQSFWRRMIKGEHADKPGMYGILAYKTFVTGWILALFPYTSSGERVGSARKIENRNFSEYGQCAECGQERTGEKGCGQFYCQDCWRAFDLKKHWSNIRVNQCHLADGLLTADIVWEKASEKVGDVKVYGGLIGSSVPKDELSGLKPVRGYIMQLIPTACRELHKI